MATSNNRARPADKPKPGGVEEMRQVAAERAEQMRVARKWVWGHRTVLGPVAAGVADLAAGAVIHAHHFGTASVGLAVVCSALVARQAAARWCTGTVAPWVTGAVGASGAWLTASTMANPTSLPMVGMLATGATVCGVGFARAQGGSPNNGAAGKRTDYTDRWAELAAKVIGLPGSKVIEERHDPLGVTLLVELPAGQDGETAISTVALRRVESAFGLRRSAVSGETVEDGTRLARLRILTVDPHSQPLLWTGRTMTSILDALLIGTHADGTDVLLRFYDHKGGRHMLVGGASRSGKSSLINLLLCELVGLPDVFLIGADLKDGQELGPWRGALPLVVDTPVDTLYVLRVLAKVLEVRAKTCGSRKWIPAPGRPAIVMVIDECAELWAEPGAIQAAESIARRGLSLGVHLVLATQYPTWAATGSRTIRSQSTLRACFRMNEKGQSGVILQDLKGLVDAASLPDRGGFLFFESPEAARAMRARGVFVEDDVMADVIGEAREAGWSESELDEPSMKVLAPLLKPASARDAVDSEEEDPGPMEPKPTRKRSVLPALADELPPLPDALRHVSLSRVTGVERTDPEPDSAEKVAEDKATALRLMTESGPAGAQLKVLLKETGRPPSTMHDWLEQWKRDGVVVKVAKGRYRALDLESPAEATGT